MAQSNSASWQSEMVEEVKMIAENRVKEWAELINKLGMNTTEREEWTSIFKKEINDLMGDLVQDVEQTHALLLNNIETLLKQSEVLCKQLRIKMPEIGSENLGLYNEEKALKKTVEDLKSEVDQRLQDLIALKKRRDEVSQQLGRKPREIPENPLPSKEDINSFIKYINGLEEERNLRLHTFYNLKSEIQELVDQLKIEPSLDFEKMILLEDDTSFAVTDVNMKMLQNFHESLVQQAENVRTEIFYLREKIRSLWEILSEDLHDCDSFLQKYPDNSLTTLEDLKKEVKRCEDLKKANIKVFVEKLRKELTDLWDKCKFSEIERSHFHHLHDDLFTEDLLTLHDIELNKLKKYYSDNNEIYKLLDKREGLWSKMMELEERASAPDRYKNRGGQLLKEEKERNVLLKKIPEIEEKLLELAAAYEIKTGKNFMCWGETLDMIIQRRHESYEYEKKQKLSTRKMQREMTLTPAKSQLSLAPSTSHVNLFKCTPLKNSNLNVVRTPKNLSVSKKTAANTPLQNSAKKFKINNNGRVMTSNLQVGSVSKVKLRYSTEKKKRIERLRRLSKLMEQKKALQTDESTASDYENFQTELSNKGTCRSTLFSNDLCHTPQPMRVKPTKIFVTPATPARTPKVLSKVTPKFSATKGMKADF